MTTNDESAIVTLRREISQIGLSLSGYRGRFEHLCAAVDDLQDVMQDFNALGPSLLHQLTDRDGPETENERIAPDATCSNESDADADNNDRDSLEALATRLVIVSQKFRTKFGKFLHTVWYPLFGVSHRLHRAINDLVRRLDLQLQATDLVEVANELILEARNLECLNEQFVASRMEFDQAVLTMSVLQQQVISLRQMEEKLEISIAEGSSSLANWSRFTTTSTARHCQN